MACSVNADSEGDLIEGPLDIGRTEEIGLTPRRQCPECHVHCHIRCNKCPSCHARFPPSKKKLALGPPKKYPSNLLAQLHKKANQLHQVGYDVTILTHKSNTKLHTFQRIATPGAAVQFNIMYEKVYQLWKAYMNAKDKAQQPEDQGDSEQSQTGQENTVQSQPEPQGGSEQLQTGEPNTTQSQPEGQGGSEQSQTGAENGIQSQSEPLGGSEELQTGQNTFQSQPEDQGGSEQSQSEAENGIQSQPEPLGGGEQLQIGQNTFQSQPESQRGSKQFRTGPEKAIQSLLEAQVGSKQTLIEAERAQIGKENAVQAQTGAQERQLQNVEGHKSRKRRRCGDCAGCKKPKCQKCQSCLNPRWKKPCRERKCLRDLHNLNI